MGKVGRRDFNERMPDLNAGVVRTDGVLYFLRVGVAGYMRRLLAGGDSQTDRTLSVHSTTIG